MKHPNEGVEYAIRQAALQPENPHHGAALLAYALLRFTHELMELRHSGPELWHFQRLHAADEEVEKYIRSRGYLG